MFTSLKASPYIECSAFNLMTVEDTLKPPNLRLSTRWTLFWKEIFANHNIPDPNALALDSSVHLSPLAPKRAVIPEFISESITNDTLSLFYKKYKKRKNKTKGKTKKIWIDGEFFNYVKNYILKNSIDSLYSSKAIYQSHQVDLDYYLENFLDTSVYKTEIDWSAIQKVQAEPFFKKNISNVSKKKIYGFHPYWMGNSYYNYDYQFFDRIAYFGYVIDPSNGLDLSTAIDLNAHSWENTTLHKKAALYGCKIDLCIASYLIENNALIFDDSKESQVLRSRLIDQIVQLVTDRGNGVCFDIQKVPVHYKSNYIDLIKSVDIMLNGSLVDRSLSDSAKRYEITVVLPRFDVGFPYEMNEVDYRGLFEYVDRWIMTGESYYGSDNTIAEFSESKIDGSWDYEAIDAQINKYAPSLFDDLLLEIPLHHSRLVLIGEDTVRDVVQYRHMMALYPEQINSLETSFRERLLYASKKEIKGVAIWAMGYGFETDIREVLLTYCNDGDLNVDQKVVSMIDGVISRKDSVDLSVLSSKDLSRLETVSLPKSHLMKFTEDIMKKKTMVYHAIVLCLIVLLAFVFCGFIISMFFETSRELILSKESFLNGALLIVFIGICLFIKRMNVIDNTTFTFTIGIILGLFISFLILSKRKKKEVEETP